MYVLSEIKFERIFARYVWMNIIKYLNLKPIADFVLTRIEIS